MTTPNTTFQPAFKRVAQQDRHDDTFAVIAILTGKTLESVLRQAETLGIPKVGPYYAHIDGEQLTENQCQQITMAGYNIRPKFFIEEQISGSVPASQRPGFQRKHAANPY